MKLCGTCDPPTWKSLDEFSLDTSNPDGRAANCLECNKRRCKEWYAKNYERKKAQSLAYKAEHGRTTTKPADEKRAEAQRKPVPKPEEEEPDDWQLIRFTASEWLHCLVEAEQLGVKTQEYVRMLVRDDMQAAEQRRVVEIRQEQIRVRRAQREVVLAARKREREAEEAARIYTREAAERLHMGQGRLRGLIDQGKLPTRLDGKRFYLLEEDLRDYCSKLTTVGVK